MNITTPLIGSVATGFGATAPAPELGYKESDEGLKAASRDFTSILFSYMFSSMRGNPDDRPDEESGGSLFGGENVDMFMGFLDQEIGKKFAEQGGKDMVDALYHQLKGDKVYADEKDKPEKNDNKSS
ncbi:MAG: rod-binding protein [Candidatus Sericytochromatia bacterium]